MSSFLAFKSSKTVLKIVYRLTLHPFLIERSSGKILDLDFNLNLSLSYPYKPF